MSRIAILTVAVSFFVFGFFLASATVLPASKTSAIQGDKPTPVPDSVLKEFTLWTQFAAASYCTVEGWKCGEPCEGDTKGTSVVTEWHTKPPFPANGYVAVNDKYKAIIVAFRGTSGLDDMVVDFNTALVPYDGAPGAMVHKGFYSVNKVMSAKLVTLVGDLAINKHPDYRVIVTGHSLGATISLFYTLDLIASNRIPKERLFMYTVGSPRAGDTKFAQFVDSLAQKGYQLFRGVNKADIVPHMPQLLFNYRHHGPEYWYTPDNKLVKVDAAETAAGSNSDTPFSVPDHALYFGTNMLVKCKA